MNQTLLDTVAPLQRLSLGYAPEASRTALLAFFALDARFAGIVRNSREPMLAQLRLSWWREQIASSDLTQAGADPLIEALQSWPGERGVLSGLAEGWEALTGPTPLPAEALDLLAQSRGNAFAALAGSQKHRIDARRMGENWALADIAAHLSDERERKAALQLASSRNWQQASLPRSLRPLAVLHALAARSIRRNIAISALSGAGAALTALRAGLLGR